MASEKLKTFLVNYKTVLLIFPALILCLFSYEINTVSQGSLVFLKLCVHVYNDSICDDYVYKNSTFQNEIESLANNWTFWSYIALLVPALFSVLYMNSLADSKLNYRNSIVISLCGFITQSVLFAVASWLDDTYISLWVIISAQFLNGLLGGGSLAFISSCYTQVSISDTTASNMDDEASKKRLAIKFSILEASLIFSRFLGSTLSGFILKWGHKFVNFQRTYYITTSLFIAILIYVCIIFKYLKPDEQAVIEHQQKTSQNGKPKFSLQFLKDTVSVLTKKRPNNQRYYTITFFTSYFIVSIASFGLELIDYLYLINQPISLNQTEYGILKGIGTFLNGVSLLIILPVLRSVFGITDIVFGLFGFIAIEAYFVVGVGAYFYRNAIWLNPLPTMFSRYYAVSIRSFLSKIHDKNEIGKIFGLISISEFVAFLIGSSICNRIYSLTLKSSPYVVYIFSGGVCLLCLPIFTHSIMKLRKSNAMALNSPQSDSNIN